MLIRVAYIKAYSVWALVETCFCLFKGIFRC